jgi:subtilisin family serine protease
MWTSAESNLYLQVAYIQADYHVSVDSIEHEETEQYNLHALSHKEHNQTGPKEYLYSEEAGKGTFAYIFDSGIDVDHEEFEGRVEWGKTFISGEKDEDCKGHGTHVAGIVGGKTYGVAKKTTLVAVKVLNCAGQGSQSTVIKGMEWAIKDMRARNRAFNPLNPESLGLRLTRMSPQVSGRASRTSRWVVKGRTQTKASQMP